MRSLFVRSGAVIALFLVSCAAGYWVSAHLGRDLLRDEVEAQLSRLLQGSAHVADAHLRFTPRPVLELSDAQVDYPGSGGLRARWAVGGIDPLALLTGRFRLDWLTIDGLVLRVERGEEGPWTPPFMEPPPDPEGPARPAPVSGSLEAWIAPLGWPDGLARLFLGRPWAARNVRLIDATLEMHDARPVGEDDPVELTFREIDIRVDHDWLAGRPSLAATAAVYDPQGARGTIELRGERARRGALKLEIAALNFPLAALRPYAKPIDPHGDLDGRLTGVFDWQSPERGHGKLDLDLLVEDSRGGIDFGDGRLRLDTERVAVGGSVETTPGRLIVHELQLRGPELGLELDLRSERPLRPEALARARISLLEIGIGTAARVAAALPESDRAIAERLLARIHSGRIEHLTLHGTANLREWERLASGELAVLPQGFKLTSRVEELTLGLAEEAQAAEANARTGTGDSRNLLSDLSADFEWEGQRIALWNARMQWQGERFPRLDVVAHGAQNLLAASPEATRLEPGAVALPGLPALLERFSGNGEAGPMPALQIEIDELHHPALRWPVEHALARIEGIESGGYSLSVPRAHWAGVPVRARGTIHREPEAAIALTLWAGNEDELDAPAIASFEASAAALEFSGPTLGALPPLPADPNARPDSSATAPRQQWGGGRLHVGGLGGPFPTAALTCELVLEGEILRVPRLEATLEPAGRGQVHGAIDLGKADRLGVNLAFELENADLATVTAGLSLPADLFEGVVDAKGALEGDVVSGEALHRNMRGVIEIDARDGRIQSGIPLISAVAHASEGFNPFAARDHIRFETLTGVFEMDRGVLASEELSVDGPVRIFASGEIDLRAEAAEIDALVGVFVLRHADLLLGDVPIVNWLIPGSDRGLLGAYFQVDGLLADPRVQTHAAQSLAGGVPLPDVVRAPFKALRAFGEFLVKQGASSEGPRKHRRRRLESSRRGTPPAAPAPASAPIEEHANAAPPAPGAPRGDTEAAP